MICWHPCDTLVVVASHRGEVQVRKTSHIDPSLHFTFSLFALEGRICSEFRKCTPSNALMGSYFRFYLPTLFQQNRVHGNVSNVQFSCYFIVICT